MKADYPLFKKDFFDFFKKVSMGILKLAHLTVREFFCIAFNFFNPKKKNHFLQSNLEEKEGRQKP